MRSAFQTRKLYMSAQLEVNHMEIAQTTPAFGSSDQVAAPRPAPPKAVVDRDRLVSLMLGRDGVAKAFVLVVPVLDAPRASGPSASAAQRAADGADLPHSLPSRSPAAIEPIDDTGHGNSGDVLLISEIVDRLLAEVPSFAPTEQLHSANAGDIVDVISEAEARVLRYLPTNLTASEIAATLFVSVNTVKTHMRHIYAKLDAHRRREAVDNARERGLLTSSRVHTSGIHAPRYPSSSPPQRDERTAQWRQDAALYDGIAVANK
jgi:DNA-binding CsgD family transcriptional regulator